MLNNCSYNQKTLSFTTKNKKDSNKNIFTIIVGKNGTGKSRLLREIIERFVDTREPKQRQRSYDSFKHLEKFKLEFEYFPNNIIALSTSPFDRFPITRETEHIKNYEYLGLRGLFSQNLSLSFMARTLDALIRAVSENKHQAQTISEVLKYLGYREYIEARLVPEISTSNLIEIIQSSNPIQTLFETNQLRTPPFIDKIQFLIEENKINPYQLIHSIEKWLSSTKKPRLDITINSHGVFNSTFQEEIDSETLFLFEIGFFRLRDIGIQKLFSPQKIRISEASSGEQCVVMALLGIASHIQDNSLICIDEPEICLHPEWQERYIELLINTFNQFSGCHFVIATHSPQVIAKLSDENCFVLDLENGKTSNGIELNNRSADFQLAHTFRAPGFKNEYLTRELFNALGSIGSGTYPPPERVRELKELISLKELLNNNDPVKSLMELLETSLIEMGAI